MRYVPSSSLGLFAVVCLGFFPVLAEAGFLCAGGANSAPQGVAAKPLRQFTTGSRRAIVLFAQFHDEPSNQSMIPPWAADIFDHDRPGSLSHFYSAMSFGQLEIDGEVAPKYYRSSQGPAAYQAASPAEKGQYGLFSHEIILQADRDINYADFDNDGPDGIPNSGDDEGVVDAVFIVMDIVPPNFIGGNATGVATLGIDGNVVADDLGIDGRPINIASTRVTLQQGGTLVEAVGSMCHEYGHILGLPDLFNTGFLQRVPAGSPEYDPAGIGTWGLMGWGALGWLTGFNSLVQVGGDLKINANQGLKDLEGLNPQVIIAGRRVVDLEESTVVEPQTGGLTDTLTMVWVQSEGPLPTEYQLLQNHPNPFNARTVIGFELPADTQIVLSVYNLAGQRMRKLGDDFYQGGRHTVY